MPLDMPRPPMLLSLRYMSVVLPSGLLSALSSCRYYLGKIVDILFTKGIPSPTGNPKWTRAAVDKLLANKKYIPIVGVKGYMDAQFEKGRRCNVDYDEAGHPRKSIRYQSPSIEME